MSRPTRIFALWLTLGTVVYFVAWGLFFELVSRR